MAARYPRQTHNFVAYGIDVVGFGLGIKFIDPTTILPTLAAGLGASSTVIGLLITAFFLAWSLPQLAAGNLIARYPRKKPTLLRMAFIGRPVLFVFAFLLFTGEASPPWLYLILLFVMLAILFGTDAFAALAWFDMLGRAFPPEKRGGYLSIWESTKAAGVLIITALTTYLLSAQGPPFPGNFAALFLLAGVMMMISAMALIAIYETPPAEGETTSVHISWREFPAHLDRIWRSDERLRNTTISRVLYSLGTMSSSFYVLYATQELGLDIQTVGLFISAQTLGSLAGTLLLGRLADRFGSARAIQVGIFLALAAPLIALGFTFMRSSLPPWIQYAYATIYLCIGIIENLLILGYMNYALDLAPPGQRTIYMGTTNAIGSAGVMGPMIGGWLLGVSSYAMLYIASAAFGVGALMLALRLPDIRSTQRASEGADAVASEGAVASGDAVTPAGGLTQSANPHPD